MTTSFSSFSSQYPSMWFIKMSSSTTKGSSPIPACMNSLSLAPVPLWWGKLLMSMEQSEREVVRSSQQSLVFLMVSRMQSRAMRWMMKEEMRRTVSSEFTINSVLMKRISQLVQIPSTPFGSYLICPYKQMSSFFCSAHVMERAEYVTSCSVNRMIAYLVKMKQRGNPNPRNSSSFEFSHNGMGSLLMMLRQHSQRLWVGFRRGAGEMSMLVLLAALAWRRIGRPGVQASPCQVANFQSGPILSKSNMRQLQLQLSQQNRRFKQKRLGWFTVLQNIMKFNDSTDNGFL